MLSLKFNQILFQFLSFVVLVLLQVLLLRHINNQDLEMNIESDVHTKSLVHPLLLLLVLLLLKLRTVLKWKYVSLHKNLSTCLTSWLLETFSVVYKCFRVKVGGLSYSPFPHNPFHRSVLYFMFVGEHDWWEVGVYRHCYLLLVFPNRIFCDKFVWYSLGHC